VEIYVASLMAIEVDTDRERQYMQGLASRMNLDGQAVAQIKRSLERE